MKVFFALFLFVLAYHQASATVTLYNPTSHSNIGLNANFTFKFVTTACDAQSAYIAFYSTNSSTLIARVFLSSSAVTTHNIYLDLSNISESRIVNGTGTNIPNGIYTIDVGCAVAGSPTKARATDVRIYTECDDVLYGTTPQSLCTSCYSNYVQTTSPCIACATGYWGPHCNYTDAQCAATRCNGHGTCRNKDDGCNCNDYYGGSLLCATKREGTPTSSMAGVIVGICVFVAALFIGLFMCTRGVCGGRDGASVTKVYSNVATQEQ
jgi:hypothetical protein